MAIFSGFRNLWGAKNLKTGRIVGIVVVIVLALLLLCGCTLKKDRALFDMMVAMYDELEEFPDFDSLRYRDGTLYFVTYPEGIEKEAPSLPHCMQALSSKRVQSVFKIGDDIFFVLNGILDNYSGYVLSQDTQIDLNELDSVERTLVPVYGLYCFSFLSL